MAISAQTYQIAQGIGFPLLTMKSEGGQMEEPKIVYDDLICQCEGSHHRFAVGLPGIGETCACGKIVVDKLMHQRWLELASNEIGKLPNAYL